MQRGNVEKRKRENKSVPFAGMDLQLPSSRVSNYTFLLQPRRPQIPEAVVTGRCQNLEDALEVLHGGDEGIVQGAVEGEGPRGVQPEGDGARQ